MGSKPKSAEVRAKFSLHGRAGAEQRRDGYRAARADRLAALRTCRPRPGKLADDLTSRRHVEQKLRLRCSKLTLHL